MARVNRAEVVLSAVLQVYLGVRLGHLLVQTLVAMDGDFQLLHFGRQPPLTAHFTPGIDLRQELRKQRKGKEIP